MTDLSNRVASQNRQPPASRAVVAMLQSQSREFGTRPLLQVGTQAWRHDEAAPAAARHATRLQTAAVLPDDTLALIYTSGTTGPAKGVICSHAQTTGGVSTVLPSWACSRTMCCAPRCRCFTSMP